jgi:hypothetical protein
MGWTTVFWMCEGRFLPDITNFNVIDIAHKSYCYRLKEFNLSRGILLSKVNPVCAMEQNPCLILEGGVFLR